MKLDSVFSPRSIAVIGATDREGSVGRSIFSNILYGGYKGLLYPVNPRLEGLLGLKCYKSILDIDGLIDLAVLIVPNVITPKVMKECAAKHVKSVVIVSAGFKETGPEGAAIEGEIKKIAERAKISLVGPNCLGVINTDPSVSLNASFATAMPKQGNIAFLSQSGALCTSILDYAKGENIGFSKFISMGNKADVTENDLLLSLKDDPKTEVILMYLEDLVDGKEFIRIAREITGEIKNRKPILAIKSGRTPQGVKAVSSHTGSLAGSDQVYNAIFAQSGVMRVDSVEELFDYAVAFANQPLPKGNRVAIVTNAGGPGIMATDAAVRYGLELSKLEKRTIDTLKKALPKTASVNNPIDIIGDAKHDRYEIALKAALNDRGVDGVIIILTPQSMTDIEEIARVVVRVSKKHRKPVLASFMGVVDVSKGVNILEQNGIPHYRFPEAAPRGFATMCNYVRWLARPRTEVRKFKANKARARKVIEKARRERRSYLVDVEAMDILSAYGLPMLESIFVKERAECVKAAKKLGYPLVMKVVSPQVVHKFDVGGVRLNIHNEDELLGAYDSIMRDVKRHMPHAKIQGVHIQEMAKRGREVILGIKRDPKFGPIIMFGLGGIYVEVLKDVTFRLAPVRELGALRMIESICSYPILKGIRGDKPSDIPKIAECIQRISQLALDIEDIEELDINPLIVYEKGKGCRVLDARILLK